MNPAVIAVGRFNPPTLGHAVLVKKVLEEANRADAVPLLFIVDGAKSSLDKSKNPLTGIQREHYIRLLFPEIQVCIVASAFHAIETLQEQGLCPVVWIAGTDRASKYRKLLASVELTGQVIEVNREAGEAEGVTATAARKAALAGDLETFKSLMPTQVAEEILAEMMFVIREETNGNPTDNFSRGDCVS